MDSKFIIDTIDSISIQQPKDVVMTRITDYVDDKLFESKIRIVTSSEIIINGITMDNEDFLVKIPVDSQRKIVMYTGHAAREALEENMKDNQHYKSVMGGMR